MDQSIESTTLINFDRHAKYFQMCLDFLPEPYVGLDTSRLSAVYFGVIAMDMLGRLDVLNRHAIIEFIYNLQISINPECRYSSQSGFIGSTFLGSGFQFNCSENENNECNCCDFFHSYVQSHIAMSYTSIMILLTLKDDLSRINKLELIQGMRKLQHPSGAFQATREGSECDMRFLYCACAISAALQDWSGVNCDSAVCYIMSCVTYEGGISLIPGSEAHGGSTYCAVAALSLMGRLDTMDPRWKSRLVKWCIHRQHQGYSGRTNKDTDSCYSFWVGATLKLLGEFSYTDISSTMDFLLNSCQSNATGGFSKIPKSYPDILHSFYSLSWLSMTDCPNIKPIDPRFGICSEIASCY